MVNGTRTTVAGATFRQTELHQTYEKTQGRPFLAMLFNERDNQYDSNAIMVVNGDMTLGYIPRSEQAKWSEAEVECHIEHWQEKDLYLAKILHSQRTALQSA